MIYRNYRLIILCLVVANVQAADEHTPSASSATEQRLQFTGCIEVCYMPMHGVPRYYEPVTVFKKFVTEGKLHSGCKSIVGGRNGSFLRSKQCYQYWDAVAGLGFIEGPNADLTAEVTARVLNLAPEFSDLGFKYAAIAALQSVTETLKKERPAVAQQLDSIKVDVDTYASGSDVSIIVPNKLKRKFLKKSLDITNEKHVEIFRRAAGTKKQITHSMPYLVINRMHLDQFVQQEGIGMLVSSSEAMSPSRD